MGVTAELSVDERGSPAEPLRQRRAVGDDDEDRLLLGVQLEQQRGDRVGRRAIEVAGRLVAQQQRRIADQRPRDGGALLLAAGSSPGR